MDNGLIGQLSAWEIELGQRSPGAYTAVHKRKKVDTKYT